ncbi:MAG: hypothetical protein UV02_C0022G0010 [Candidatus Kuenenbacteria bacterium GW2011_GWA2_42_15]|uniref:Uncharacterized protein n=4 Tax=Candidatus Kueneniibacteriota TaxID=1752740 RepID=A0A0G0YZB2_9BACT|nr:MAG: hypothetical protein UV02_C0022G0010 [Candidatus Kuenenbacteria bacterium GW2011_GWA2_42_15]OGG90590.1 MAG: hypothetical protein A3H55_03920 [Candidatus Kuenenbacteria bacterium RIFCSPLOWO2_02_FULL_42_16]OGG95892.1 MAG: hypothetical protein A2V95_01220 [Candidatus Kuenenbacteria bacterium RBG_16_41_7]
MIIFISGSINSGKTTIAKILHERLENSALVEIDSLHAFVEKWIPIEEAIGLNLENAAAVIKNFVKHGIDVIVPYPLLKKNYKFLIENLKDANQQIYFFTLNPKLEIVLKNRGERKLTDWEKERIKHHYQIGINKPEFGEIIDNSSQAPEQTALIVLEKITQHLCN